MYDAHASLQRSHVPVLLITWRPLFPFVFLVHTLLQLAPDPRVSRLQRFHEHVRVFAQPLHLRLRPAVLPNQLFCAQRDVQQPRLAEDVVSVAEALYLVVRVGNATRITTGAAVRGFGSLFDAGSIRIGGCVVRKSRRWKRAG